LTLKELVRMAVEELLREGKEEFTVDEIYEKVEMIEPGRKRESVLATISGLVVGHKHPSYGREDQFLEKVRRGVYRVYRSGGSSERKKKGSREEAEELIDGVVTILEGKGFPPDEIAEMLEKRARALRGEYPKL